MDQGLKEQPSFVNLPEDKVQIVGSLLTQYDLVKTQMSETLKKQSFKLTVSEEGTSATTGGGELSHGEIQLVFEHRLSILAEKLKVFGVILV